MLSVTEHLGPQGPLAGVLGHYAPRPQQQAMAEAVAHAIEGSGVLVCEAGTGTGKTFAYLVPSLLSGRKVIISTGTKSLQEQLFHRDMPLVRDALGTPVKVALLKGRSNYLCAHRLAIAEVPGYGQQGQMPLQLARIRDWAAGTRGGDIAEVPDIPEDAPVWRYATSTAENCLGQDCPALADCHVLKARRAAVEADLVVVNHHLFFADMALREEGFGELLPGADAVILDEAHQISEVATQFFGTSLSARQLVELSRDTLAAYYREAGDVPPLVESAQAVEGQVRVLRLAFGTQPVRVPWSDVAHKPQVREALDALARALSGLEACLAPMGERGRDLESCHRRCTELRARLTLMTGEVRPNYLQWVETYTRSFTLHMTPLDIAQTFSARVAARRCAWVFTSATLAVDGRFTHFAERLGLADPSEALWESPFDFEHQALCYSPSGLPNPGAPDYTIRMLEASLPVLRASQGRAFLLFTSHRALREAAEYLTTQVDYPLFVQGDAPRSQLLQRFRETPHAVLLGTSSFWEGIDVRGEALSCVIIDKLPFASPGDPVLQARNAAIRERGGNPFVDYQLPQAVIALKQGSGRLIRDSRDRGVLVLCDPRLYTRGYGRVFLDSLPPMPRTRDLERVRRFFAEGQP